MSGALVTDNKWRGVRVGKLFIENRGTNGPLVLGREIPHYSGGGGDSIVRGPHHPAILAPSAVWQ
jgi:hypothetical protein